MDHVTALTIVPRGGSVHRECLGGSEGAAVWGLGAQRLQLLTREKAASNQPRSEARLKDKDIGAVALNSLQGVQDRDIFTKRGQRVHIVLAIRGHRFTSNIPADDAKMTSLSVGSVFAKGQRGLRCKEQRASHHYGSVLSISLGTETTGDHV